MLSFLCGTKQDILCVGGSLCLCSVLLRTRLREEQWRVVTNTVANDSANINQENFSKNSDIVSCLLQAESELYSSINTIKR